MLPVPVPAADAPVRSPRDMRLMATGMLIAMAMLFLIARATAHHHPAIGFVQAFAEAAMVGGLADWFAVTALFRHPLGLPIPHTAIIPRNKDRIGATLALFLRDNFLTPAVVARRMQKLDVAAAAGRFLASPSGGDGRLREGASRLAADMLEALDQERLGGMVKGAIAQRLRGMNLAPLLGQAIEAAMRDGRHAPVMDGIIHWADRTLEANDHLIRQMVHERAGKILRWTGLDENLSNAIIDGLRRMLAEMAADPGHSLRLKAEEGMAKLANDLQFDPAMQERVARIRDEIVDNPAMQRWIDGLWEQARSGLLRAVRDPGKAMAGRLGEALQQLGGTLQESPRLRLLVNRFVRRAAVGATASYGDSIVKLVSETVRGWDAGTVTSRLENAVGRDLQYIRINGTLVGGLVGLAIHAIDMLF
ncbi:Membrane protein [Sphingobium herbicidovorans NBRC 16415]|uniref:Membrane protein n=2 Tax=Sphingobium herbicidovorans TaxID=76947 RepID=A0A086PDE0_SPHHM|nr:Membrane protein [Sphingobium herbicidovorans NBRC 16415]